VTETHPGRVVADADVLAADLLIGGPARAALDHVRAHSWIDLVASDQLLADAVTVIAELATEDLATDWRERIEAERVRVDHPEGDHPALASAYQSGAGHLLTYDERLRSPTTGLTLQPHANCSIRPPDAFARLFDPAGLYELVVGGAYPGPDRDPRA
jgi:predicted nucleic acid-binding protein